MPDDEVTGTAAPDTYKDVPVSLALDGEWNGMCGYWFRRAVEEAQVVWRVRERVLRVTIADEINERGYELRSSDEGISREEWGCYTESAEIAREGLASVRDE